MGCGSTLAMIKITQCLAEAVICASGVIDTRTVWLTLRLAARLNLAADGVQIVAYGGTPAMGNGERWRSAEGYVVYGSASSGAVCSSLMRPNPVCISNFGQSRGS
jgi:hypothetical protein